MEKLSVVVITNNDEINISRCLKSVQAIADEIIVLDSFSDDQTIAIARKSGALILQEPFKGYIIQMNRALELATHSFVLCLDGKEEIDDTLQVAILKCKEHFTYSGYRMKRCTNYCGQLIRRSSWYPDYQIRIAEKKKAKWSGIDPEGKITFTGPVAIRDLPGEIIHYSYSSKEEHLQQNEYLSSIAANANYSAGRRTNWLKLLFSPLFLFLYSYILRAGIFIPRYGFIIAFYQARYTFLKHKKLLLLQKGNDKDHR